MSAPLAAEVDALRRFYADFQGEEHELSVATAALPVGAIRDAMKRPIPGLADLSGEAVLLFVDRVPAANWAHPCAYAVLLRETGRMVLAAHNLPPAEEIDLVPLEAK